MLEAWGAAGGVLVTPEACESSSRPAPSCCALGAVVDSRGLSQRGGGGRLPSTPRQLCQLTWAGHPANTTPRESEPPGPGTACTPPRTTATSPAATPRAASTWSSKTLKALDNQLDRPSFDGKRWHPARRQVTEKRTKSGWVVDPSAGGPTSSPHSPRAQHVADFPRPPPPLPPTPPASERLQGLNAHQER